MEGKTLVPELGRPFNLLAEGLLVAAWKMVEAAGPGSNSSWRALSAWTG